MGAYGVFCQSMQMFSVTRQCVPPRLGVFRGVPICRDVERAQPLGLMNARIGRSDCLNITFMHTP